MSIKSVMQESKAPRYTENDIERFNERTVRADRLTEKWSKVAEIGSGLKAMGDGKRRNLAIMLEQQARVMSKMTEAQYSSAFAATPENMIRLVRLAYPNSIRDKLN
jgi:hypothetical protein